MSKVTKITVARLFNTGSYEHVRYEISVEVPEGESAATTMIGLEKIMSGLSPKTSTRTRQELDRDFEAILELRKNLSLPEDEFRNKFGYFRGTPAEYVDRVEKTYSENVAARDAWEKRGKKARWLLDDLGGAASWKDAKLDWENKFDDL